MTNTAAIDAITTRRALVEEAFGAGDVALLASVITDDVVWCTPAGPPWFGRRQVLDRVQGFFRDHEYELRFGPPRIDTDGHRAVDRTSFESRVHARSSATSSVHRGSVVVVWTDDDGWRISAYLDVGSITRDAQVDAPSDRTDAPP